jgi:hypothetical protein
VRRPLGLYGEGVLVVLKRRGIKRKELKIREVPAII